MCLLCMPSKDHSKLFKCFGIPFPLRLGDPNCFQLIFTCLSQVYYFFPIDFPHFLHNVRSQELANVVWELRNPVKKEEIRENMESAPEKPTP